EMMQAENVADVGDVQAQYEVVGGESVDTRTGEVLTADVGGEAPPRRLTQANPDPKAPQAIRPDQGDEVQQLLASPFFTSDERNKAMQKAMKLDERTAGGYIENLEEELRRREAADGSRHEAKEARLASPTTEAAPAPTNSDGHRTEAGPASDE